MKWNPKKKERFLRIYRETGSWRAGAEAVGISRSGIYKIRSQNETFRSEWEDAKEDYVEKLEAEADRRAVEGVARPVYFKGKVVGEIKEHSDTLLIFRLKALKPEKYRDNFHVSAKVEHSVDRETLDAIMKNPRARELLRELTQFVATK